MIGMIFKETNIMKINLDKPVTIFLSPSTEIIDSTKSGFSLFSTSNDIYEIHDELTNPTFNEGLSLLRNFNQLNITFVGADCTSPDRVNCTDVAILTYVASCEIQLKGFNIIDALDYHRSFHWYENSYISEFLTINSHQLETFNDQEINKSIFQKGDGTYILEFPNHVETVIVRGNKVEYTGWTTVGGKMFKQEYPELTMTLNNLISTRMNNKNDIATTVELTKHQQELNRRVMVIRILDKDEYIKLRQKRYKTLVSQYFSKKSTTEDERMRKKVDSVLGKKVDKIKENPETIQSEQYQTMVKSTLHRSYNYYDMPLFDLINAYYNTNMGLLIEFSSPSKNATTESIVRLNQYDKFRDVITDTFDQKYQFDIQNELNEFVAKNKLTHLDYKHLPEFKLYVLQKIDEDGYAQFKTAGLDQISSINKELENLHLEQDTEQYHKLANLKQKIVNDISSMDLSSDPTNDFPNIR
jgi:hypothetical protein